MPDIAFDHVGDEFVAHLGDRLQSPRDQRGSPGAVNDQCGDQKHDDGHHQRRVGIRDVEPTDAQRQHALDREYFEGMKLYRQLSNPRRPICSASARPAPAI